MSWSANDHIRHFMYEDVARAIREAFPPNTEPASTLQVLDFGSKWYGDPDGGWATPMRSMLKVLLHGRMHHQLATYPEYNIESLIHVRDRCIDFLVADQVLEHVQKPWRAAAEIARVVRPTGFAMVATPGLYPVHPSPLDCWRILHDGYKVLFPEHLWNTFTLGAWGSAARLGYEIVENEAFPYGPPNTLVETAEKTPHYSKEYDGRFPLQLWWVGMRRNIPIRGDEW